MLEFALQPVVAMSDLHFGATEKTGQGTDQASFLKWMDDKGIVHNKCHFPRTGRGVRAAVSLKAGDVVLEVGLTKRCHACVLCGQ